MFLGNFNDVQKINFYSLAKYMVNADYEVKNEEIAYLNTYLTEMGWKEEDIFGKEQPIFVAIDFFSSEDWSIRAQVFIELYALAICDNEYAEEEERMINDIQRAFQISDEMKENMISCVEDLNHVYKRLGEIISGQ